MGSPYLKTVGYELIHAARLHRARSAQLLSELGLFPGQERVLALLSSEDSRTMSELASSLRVKPPTVSKTIARLAAQGLVERRAISGDARVVRVALTEEGRRRAGAIGALWDTLEDEIVDGIDGKDRKRLIKLLQKIGKNVGARLGDLRNPDDEEPVGRDDED